MKVVSNGARLQSIKELASYEYKYHGMAWMPVGERMAYVLVGSNDKKAGDEIVFEADLIPYTGTIKDYNDHLDINGNQLIFDSTWYFKNGYLHNDEGPASVHIYTSVRGVDEKEHNATDGFFEDPCADEWALDVYKKFGGEEQ